LMRVGSTLEVVLSGQVGAHGLRCGAEAESRCSRLELTRELGLIALRLLGDMLLLGNEVVDAFFELHNL